MMEQIKQFYSLLLAPMTVGSHLGTSSNPEWAFKGSVARCNTTTLPSLSLIADKLHQVLKKMFHAIALLNNGIWLSQKEKQTKTNKKHIKTKILMNLWKRF